MTANAGLPHLAVVQPVPPIGSGALMLLLLQCGLLLGTALILGRLASSLGLPPLVGELLAGALLGPSLLGHVAPQVASRVLPHRTDQFHLLDAVGQVSVLLLVGLTGMHMDAGLVRRRGLTAVRVSACGLVLPLALGIVCGLLVPASVLSSGGSRTVFALFLGVAMCVTAIPVIAKTLIDMDLLHRNVGQLTLAAGMVDDTVGWLLLSVVAAMTTTGLSATGVATSAAALVAMLLVAALAGTRVARIVLRLCARVPEAGPTIAATVVMLLLAGAASQALGFEAVFGAFVGGMAIGSSGALDRARLAPLRSVVTAVLAPLFFAAAGLRIDLTALVQPSLLATALAVLGIAIFGKFVGAAAGALSSGIGGWQSVALGAAMNARGVIEVVVASVGLRLGVLDSASYTIVILVALVTSLMAPPILRWAMAHVDRTEEEDLRRAAGGW